MAAKTKRPSGAGGGGDHSSRRWKPPLLILLTIAATVAAPPAPPESSECDCALFRAEEHVLCRQIGRLCFKDPSAKVGVEGLTVRKLTLSDARYSGTLTFNSTEFKANLGVDLSKLEELSVHNTSASRMVLCSTGRGSHSSEHHIPCGNMVHLRKIDLRGNALTSLGELGQLPAIQELRISGEWELYFQKLYQ